jgi:hypothetical protein
MRAIDFDDPVYSKEEMTRPSVPIIAPPTEQEVADLLSVLEKKFAYKKVDLYAEPIYGRSIEIELFIVREWAANRCKVRQMSDQAKSRCMVAVVLFFLALGFTGFFIGPLHFPNLPGSW